MPGSLPPCPACETPGPARHCYHQIAIPVHSCVVLESRDAAQGFPRGDMRLACCPRCGFLWNAAFDPKRMRYAEADYEESQCYSPCYRGFQAELIESLVERHDLRGKRVLEIGSGKGDFLRALCERAECWGTGFDPAFRPDRSPPRPDPTDSRSASRVTFVRDLYSRDYAHLPADFVCCRMTLEHVADPLELLRAVRVALSDRPRAVLHVQVPDAMHALRNAAFWDVYYEHCSYFTAGSLARLFRRAGFKVLDLYRRYDGQYLLAEGRPADGPSAGGLPPTHPLEEAPEVVDRRATNFAEDVQQLREQWNARLADYRRRGQRVALWGSGSKAVAFLGMLDAADQVEQVVDINPHRHDKFLAGSGHRILAPAALADAPPDVVVVMNPVYREEIAADLVRLGIAAEVIALEGARVASEKRSEGGSGPKTSGADSGRLT